VATALASAAIMLGASTPASAEPNVTVQLHVAPNGADSGTCAAAAHPCSLTRAKQVLHDVLERHATGSVVVELAGGTYSLDEPLVFGPEDSGKSASQPVIWRAKASERPVLSGGLPLSNWSQVDGEEYFSAPVPAGTRSRQLFQGDERMPRASVSGGDVSGWQQTATGYTADASPYLTPDDAPNLEFLYPGQIERRPAWADSRCGVASIAPIAAGRVEITMDQPCYKNARLVYPNAGIPNSIENGLALLDRPGEWYLDETNDRVLYLPRPGESMASANATLAVSDGLLEAQGLKHSVFQGLTFAHGTWLGASGPDGVSVIQANVMSVGDAPDDIQMPSTIAFHSSEDLRFVDNVLRGLGGGGLAVDEGSVGVVIEGNAISDISGHGITIGNGTYTPLDAYGYAPPEWIEDDVTVENNSISDVGVEFRGSSGIFAPWVKNTRILHNEVFRAPYSGIALGYGWGNTHDAPVMGNNHVDFNYVHDVMTSSLDDGGGIYLNGLQWAEPRSSVIGNVVDGMPKKYAALYFDTGSSNYDVSRNVITRAPQADAVYLSAGAWGPQTRVRNVDVRDNYGSVTTKAVRPNPSAGNTIGANSFNLTEWPQEAQEIIDVAGLEPDFAAILPDSQYNFAADSTTTSSSDYSAGNSSAHAVDGHGATLWSSASADTSPWWQVDLGEPLSIDRVSLLTRQRNDYGGEYRKNFEIVGSNEADMSSPSLLCSAPSIDSLPHGQEFLLDL
jgi:hypothetical protein